MKQFLKIAFVLIFVFGYIGCGNKNEHQTIPEVPVNLSLDISSTIYINLSHVGGYEYISGGYKGIVVYRLSIDEFVAYDRACPYHPHDDCAMIGLDQSGIILTDTCCGSQFNLLDGTVTKGPAKFPLKKYYTMFDGQILQISN